MSKHKIIFEIELDAETPLEAAKLTQVWLQNKDNDWQFYVQDETNRIYSVDLQEHKSLAIQVVNIYKPIIR